jgi:hypothetical protein
VKNRHAKGRDKKKKALYVKILNMKEEGIKGENY